MTTPSIPHEDGHGHEDAGMDFDAMLRAFSVNGTDADEDADAGYTDGTGDADGAAGTQAGDTPIEYWQRQAFTLDEFLRRPRKQWLLPAVFGERDFVLLYGESGHGKTHVALDMAFACATGRTFADTFTVARPLTVAYCTGEGVGGLTQRMQAVSQFYNETDVQLYVFADIPQLYQTTQPNGATAFMAAWQNMAAAGRVPAQLDVLILDTLHNATAGSDENSAKDAGVVQAAMRRLRDALGCAIVLVHHAGKNGVSERGSSAIRASMDTVLRATKSGRTYTLACEKLKDGETWPAKAFDLVAVGDTESVRVFWQGDAKRQDGDKATHADKALAFLCENAGQKFTATEIANAIGLTGAQAKNVYRDLRTLKSAGSVCEEFTGRQSPAKWYAVETA